MSEDARRRVLIVMTEVVSGQAVSEVLHPRLGDGQTDALVVAPALVGSAFKHAMGDVDDAQREAQQRLDESLERLRHEEGLHLEGTVGDSDPVLAIQDALMRFPADEILILTRPEDEKRWLEGDVFDRARRQFEPPIVHVSLEAESGAHHGDVTDVESSGPGMDPPPGAELDTGSRNMPKLSARDIAGILVALVGTIVLVVLAGSCEGAEVQRDTGAAGEGTDGGCVARYVIAGAVALVNIAHVVGLMLFQSVRYRGGWERMFANMSLYGTPLAIVVSLLVA